MLVGGRSAVARHRAGRRHRRRRRPGADVRLRLPRDAAADAAADHAGARADAAAGRGPQGRRDRVAAAGRQEPGHGRVRGRPAACASTPWSSRPSTTRRWATTSCASTVIEKIIRPVVPASSSTTRHHFHINPTGRFVIGGPQGDCGLTGRKIIVDTYGGHGQPRRRRLLGQGPDQGRPLGELHGAPRGEEPGRGRPRRPRRGPARLRHRGRRAGLDPRRDGRHAARSPTAGSRTWCASSSR